MRYLCARCNQLPASSDHHAFPMTRIGITPPSLGGVPPLMPCAIDRHADQNFALMHGAHRSPVPRSVVRIHFLLFESAFEPASDYPLDTG